MPLEYDLPPEPTEPPEFVAAGGLLGPHDDQPEHPEPPMEDADEDPVA